VLEFDMVEEGVCWFADRGSPTLRVLVDVRSPPKIRRGVLSWIRGSAGDTPKPAPRAFGMYAVPRARVVQAVQSSGGRLLEIESYNPAGEGWESYRYYVGRGVNHGA
jgi:hypothetical protein